MILLLKIIYIFIYNPAPKYKPIVYSGIQLKEKWFFFFPGLGKKDLGMEYIC